VTTLYLIFTSISKVFISLTRGTEQKEKEKVTMAFLLGSILPQKH
jgi:hypothetical protein